MNTAALRTVTLWSALALAACQNNASPPSSSAARPDGLERPHLFSLASTPRPETHERATLRLFFGTERSAEAIEVADGALDAVEGPDGQVAFVDRDGLWLWAKGQRRFAARAHAWGLSANAAGVLFASAAERGAGGGLSFATWSGEVRVLIPATEELPGPAGYHHLSLSPDGTLALAFSDLTPRPSLWRVDLGTLARTQVGGEIPSTAERPRWAGPLLTWKDAEGRQVSVEPVTGRVEVAP